MKLFLTLSAFCCTVGYQTHAQDTSFPGNVGVGTTTPNAYTHGGTNRVLEIMNPGTLTNSQAHLILSSGATANKGSVGSVSWVTPNSTGMKLMAFIGGHISGDATTNTQGNLVFATSAGNGPLQRAVITSNGYLGLGTDNPIRLFTLAADNNPELVFQNNGRLPDQRYYRIYTGGSKTLFGTLKDDGSSGNDQLSIDHLTGNVGIGKTDAQAYFHGGNNRVLEIHNPGTVANSQSHLILSTGATANAGSIGSVTWTVPNAPGAKGVAYIGAIMDKAATTDASGFLVFATADKGLPLERMRISPDGNIGIGAQPQQDYKLAVNGTIGSRKVKVTQETWADMVFDPAYQLPSLNEVAAHIEQNKHLPGIPSAAEVTTRGLDLGEMQKLQMQKIEELTLYIIELNRKLGSQQEQIIRQEAVINALKNKDSKTTVPTE
ncbi:hypothetical protein [Chitinophaga flava]|uniref:Peptidase S74 domain-containing protein n=1 Tax=Chitinophaga flava TaxID=2259036 RepID=A0A365XVL9_9BACT|nr:hypothetical protein [Chitinophaga flava]RBL90416.1 hypothetical protein DF182_28560 [Chitinophaga flava]